jgi:hypothetical protein
MQLKSYVLNSLRVLILSACVAPALALSPANAAIVSVTSAATDAALTVVRIPLAIGPLFPASGAAPPAYSASNGFLSYSKSLGPLTLSTGLLNDKASGSTVTGTGTATSSLADFDLSISSLGITYLSFAVSTITSTSSVNATPAASGTSSLAGATLTVLGTPISISVSPPVNYVAFNGGGLTVLLNKQTADLTESAGVTTDAIEFSFSGFPVVFGTSLNLVSGAIYVAQSYAKQVEWRVIANDLKLPHHKARIARNG